MKNKILIGVTTVLFVLLGCTPPESAESPEPQQEPAPEVSKPEQGAVERAAIHGKGHAAGDPNRRTWVVFRLAQPEDEHIGFGDAFRIQKTGPNYKLIPLDALRSRWSKPPTFSPNLVEGGADLLCGQINLPGHAAEQDHVFKFVELSSDELDVQIEIFDATKSLEEQCDISAPIHGGRAHAEN